MKILVVEDSRRMRQEIRHFLGDIAEQILERSDGAKALAAYAESQPDWVLMDIKMEVMDGITATKQIMGAFPQARIIILTSYDDDGLREAASHAGACEYVLKENLFDVRRIIGGGCKYGIERG